MIDTYFFWLGYYFYGDIYLNQGAVSILAAKLYSLIALFSLVLFNIKDLKDIEGDKKEDVKNLFTIFGKKNGKKILGVSILLISMLAPFVVGFQRIFLNSIIFGLICYIVLVGYKKVKEIHIFVLGFFFILSLIAMEYLGFNLFGN
jgi:4-hydroxybenzoate polyprenyltransferase